MQLNSNIFKSVYLSKQIDNKTRRQCHSSSFLCPNSLFYNAKRMKKMSNRRKPISKDKIGYLIAKGSNSRIQDNRYITFRD